MSRHEHHSPERCPHGALRSLEAAPTPARARTLHEHIKCIEDPDARDNAHARLTAVKARLFAPLLKIDGWRPGNVFADITSLPSTLYLKKYNHHHVLHADLSHPDGVMIDVLPERGRVFSIREELGVAQDERELEVLLEVLDARFQRSDGISDDVIALELSRRRRYLTGLLSLPGSDTSRRHTQLATLARATERKQLEAMATTYPEHKRDILQFGARAINVTSFDDGARAFVSIGGSFREEGARIYIARKTEADLEQARSVGRACLEKPEAWFTLSASFDYLCSGKRWCERYPFDF